MFKFVLAFFIFVFALWYDHIAYNLAIGTILIILLAREQISIFRFHRQLFIFSLFLLTIFVFQSVNNYGKIWLDLPFGLTVTDLGVLTAAKFVSQILLIFLVFGAAIYSSEKAEILYYLNRLQKRSGSAGPGFDRVVRIGLFSFYMAPKSLRVQRDFSSQARSDTAMPSKKIVEKAKSVLNSIYGFMHAILVTAQSEYPDFANRREMPTKFSPDSVLTLRNALILFAVFVAHGILIWQH